MLNMRPCSESHGDIAAWIEYLRKAGAQLTATLIEHANNSKWDEWVTSTSNRPGTDSLARPGFDTPASTSSAGMVRLFIRRVDPPQMDSIEPLKKNEAGIPQGLSVVVDDVKFSSDAMSLMTLDPNATHRSDPGDFHRLFATPDDMRRVIQALRNGISKHQPEARTDAKRRRAENAVLWKLMGELVTMCEHIPSDSPINYDEMLSTAWNPAALRSQRVANTGDLHRKGCRCGDTSIKFPGWLHHGCCAGVLRPKATLDFHESTALCLTILRHDLLFQILSNLRVHPIWQSHLHRGVIPEDDPTAFRVAASYGHAIRDENVHATDKYRAAFVIKTHDLKQLGLGTTNRATADLMWTKGCLLFIRAAPLSKAGKWRITLAPSSPITGDVVLVVLQRLGNMFFAQEAVRRAFITLTPSPLDRLVSSGLPRSSTCGNILRDSGR